MILQAIIKSINKTTRMERMCRLDLTLQEVCNHRRLSKTEGKECERIRAENNRVFFIILRINQKQIKRNKIVIYFSYKKVQKF